MLVAEREGLLGVHTAELQLNTQHGLRSRGRGGEPFTQMGLQGTPCGGTQTRSALNFTLEHHPTHKRPPQ